MPATCHGIYRVVHGDIIDLFQDPRFEKIVSGLGLQWRGTAGEHTDAVDSVYDISNSARLKKTEVRAMKTYTIN